MNSQSSNLLTRGIGLAKLARDARRLKRADDENARCQARQHLVERMGKLRGLPQKLGQILSMNQDQGPAFEPLTAHAEPMPLSDVVAILESAWSKSPDDVLVEISDHGLAASLGQVHRARLHDGREVAIKVRYPGITKAVENDIKMLGGLSYLAGDLKRGFDLGDYRHAILEDVRHELDYRREAENQRNYRSGTSGLSAWVIPEVLDEFSTDNVLVSLWEESQSFETAKTWSAAERNHVGKTLLSGFLHMLFTGDKLHADPHPGNYGFRRGPDGPEVVLYDYGSMTEITEPRRVALLKLFDLTGKRTGSPYAAFLALGFNPDLLHPIQGKLPALCTALFEPFTTQGAYPLSKWRRGERADQILGDDRWNFRISGPANLLLLMRAFHGLLFYMEGLQAEVPWAHALKPFLASRSKAIAEFSSQAEDSASSFDGISEQLRLEVTEAGATKVKLSMRASAVENLQDLIDPELHQRITERGIMVDAVLATARRNCYAPQTLLELPETQSEKGVRIWLQ